jgi:predicted ATPase
MRTDLPTGTVTFLFTDIEGSTKLLHELGEATYAAALADHRRKLREAFAAHGGVEVDTQGDAFFVAFRTARGALSAARDAQDALAGGPVRVRMGVHTGTPTVADEGYVGADVHKAARIAAAGHGGQVLVSAATAALVPEGLTDLGSHRLKDLSAPERIYQLGEREFPRLKTLHQAGLPVATSSFVGRERELREVVSSIRSEAVLVTLTGPGGTGKTRLALAAAAELVEDFPDGVFWVPLAAIEDADLVAAEISRVVEAKDDLAEHIADRRMLLVLDNVEQVVAAGPDLASLCERCPNVRLLVTSRELLRVRGEREYRVAPLRGDEAAALFSARSGVTDEVVLELCRRLDNLPLAIELAAARARVLSPTEILERLERRLDLFKGGRDVDERQQTLRGAIEWSHALLDPDEQSLFRRLAVFRGGWTLDAAERAVDASIDTIASLADKSLVERSGDRFGMLETIRVFAEERLAESREEDVVRERHLAYYADLAEGWYEERFTSESTLLPVVDAEADNVRAALDWAEEYRPADAARLAGAVSILWWLSGRTIEARERLRTALTQHPENDAVRARAMTHLGELSDDATLLADALALWREIGDGEGVALALEDLGWAYDAAGDYPESRAAHEQSLDVRARIGSPEVRGLSARAGLCHVLVATGETAAANRVAQELLGLARQHHAVLMEELALHFLADCPLVDGDWAEAEARYRRALAYARDAGLIGRVIDETLGIAMARAGRGDFATALRIAAAAAQKRAELGRTDDAWWHAMQERLLGAAREGLTADEVEAAEAQGRTAGLEEVVGEVLSEATANAA